MTDSIFGRWRFFADRLWRSDDAHSQFEREYGDWYRNKFGADASLTASQYANFFNLWATYKMGCEDALAAGTGTAETSATSARAEGCQSGPATQGNAQTSAQPSGSNPISPSAYEER